MKLIVLAVYFILCVKDTSRVSCQLIPGSIGSFPSSPTNIFATGYYGFIVKAFFLKIDGESYFWRYGEDDSFRDTSQFYISGSGCMPRTSSNEDITCGEVTSGDVDFILSDLTYLQPLTNDLVISVRSGTPNDVSSPAVMSLPSKNIQDCPRTLESNVNVQFNKAEYNDTGTFTCSKNGKLFYSNGSQPTSNQTTCLYTAEWSGQDNVTCWTAPNPVRMNATNGMFTIVEGNDLTVTCEYNDVIPNGTNTVFYLDDNEVGRQQERSFALSLQADDKNKQVSCQAVTPYTEIFKGSGRSPNYSINVQYISSSVINTAFASSYLIETDSGYLLRSDQALSMNCSSQGNPTPQCAFTFCSGECKNITNTGNQCFISQYLSVDGLLSCLAYNKVGSHRSEDRNITVIPASRNVTVSDAKNVIGNKTISRRLGEPLTLICSISHADELKSTFIWTYPNMTTQSSSVLKVSSLNPLDTGNYICTTYDAFGNFTNNIYIDVIYAPFQDKPTSCQWALNQPGSCDVTFMSNPQAEFLALIKNDSGEKLEGGKLMNDVDSMSQTFQFMKNPVEESDKGTYILYLKSTVLPYNHTIQFKVDVNNSITNNSTLVIALAVTGAVLAIILIIVVIFIYCKRRKTSQKNNGKSSAHSNEGMDEAIEDEDGYVHFHQSSGNVLPAATPSTSHYLTPIQPSDKHSYETIIPQPMTRENSYQNIQNGLEKSNRGAQNHFYVEQNAEDEHGYMLMASQKDKTVAQNPKYVNTSVCNESSKNESVSAERSERR